MGLTKAQLEALNVASFPNNNEGLITPQILRDYNSASIANTVNQDTYTTDSASFDSRINALDPSGSVASFTALNDFTASQLTINTGYNTFTQSADGRLDSLEATTSSLNSSITQLNANTASQQSSINQLNTNSASVNSSISQLNASSASQQTSINNLNSFTASQSSTNSGFTNSINALNTSASLAVVTASVAGQTLTFTKGDTSTFSVTLPSGSGGSTDITALNAFTASQLTINAGYNTTTASLNSSVSQLNANTASQQTQIDSLISATASYANSASVAAVDAAQQSQINALIASTASADNTSLNAFTASQLTINSGYNTFTQSANQRLTAIESVSGSWITESETSSFARVNVDNPWSVTQNFTNITAVSASFQYVQTIFETASVIFSSGSNQFGDAANDVQTLYGSTRIMNELTASGLKYPTADNGAKSFIQTDGAGNLSLQYVETVYFSVRNMSGVTLSKGTPVYISGSTGDNGNAFIADATNQSTMPATCILAEDLTDGAVGLSIISGEIEGIDTTGYPAGSEIYVAEGGGWTLSRPSGSASIVQKLGVVTKEGVGGQGHVINQLEAELPNLQTGYLWVGNGSNQPIAIASSSLVTNVSGYTTTASFNSYTSSTNSRLNNIETTTASLLIETQNLELFSASALSSISQLNASSASQQISINNLNTTTSSVNSSLTNLNTFTSSANQRLTAIESVSGSWITESETSSFARTNTNNTFTGVNSFGQVSFTGSAPTIVSQSFSGSLITNLTDIYTDIPAVQQIVTLSSASYAALVSGSLTDPNTLYIVSGSISGSGGGTTDITSLNAFTASQQLLNSTFATTGSNTFVGQQNIQNTLVIEEGGNPLIYTQFYQNAIDGKLYITQAGASGVRFDNVNVTMNELTASLQQGYVWVGNASGITTLVATSSFGGGSTDITALNAFTASQLDINTGYNTFTQSANQRLTAIETVSGSWITESETGSFATTGSNTFNGTEIVSGNVFVSGSVRAWGPGNDFEFGTYSSDFLGGAFNLFADKSISTLQMGGNQETNIEIFANGGNYDTFKVKVDSGSNGTQFQDFPAGAAYSTWMQVGTSADLSSLGEVTLNRNTNISGNLDIQSTLTASLEQGYVWVGDANNKTSLVPTSSFGSGGSLPAGLLSSSVTNFTDYSASVDTRINNIVTGTGFATTGSNNFIGVETIGDVPGGSSGEVYLLGRSGSLVLSNSTVTPTYASLSHISSSQINSNTNLIFKTSTATADTIVSGSNNLFVNPAAATAGFKRYIGGSANIALNASNVPQISGSMQFSPTMNNNIFNGNSTATTMRGPVSSSAWTISGNSLQGQMLIGTNATNHAQGIVAGLNMLSNVTNGNFGVIANKANLTQALNVSQNSIGGALTLTAASSSITWTGNTSQGTVTLTNTVSGSGATVASGSNAVYANQNIIGGSLTINASGAELSDDPTGLNFLRTFERNLITGNGNTVSLNSNTTGSHALASTAIIGNNLTITGSSASPLFNSGITNHGAAFFGRYNALDGNKAKSSETVFAIGTGTSTTRKTGFLIDSGSNSYFEGTVNVSGSLFVNGVEIVSGSGGGSINTGSFAITGSNTFIGGQQVVGPIQASDTNLGPQWVPGVAFQGVGSSSVAYDQFVNGGNYDAFHVQSNLGAGTDFQDLRSDTFALQTWLNIPTNTGNNPAPQFKRGMGITGSVSVSGSVTFRGNTTFTSVGGNSTNIILGANALANATTANNSVAIGENALLNNTTGNNNFALGNQAMYENTTGYQNVAMGVGALYNNTTGYLNVAIGNDAMISCGTASFQNVAIGSNALKTAIGNNNFGLGVSALENNTGNANIALGQEAGKFASGSSNVLVGQRAGQYLTGSANTILGGYESTAGTSFDNNIILADGVGNVRAQYSGSAWSLQGEIKLNKGSNKPADIVTVNGSATISNSLVTSNSIILVTCQDRQNQGDEYAPVVGNKTTGAFDIFTNYGGNMQVAYLIINPTA